MTAATLVLYAKLYAPHSHTTILMTLRHPALAKNLVRRCQFLLLAIHFIHVTRALRRSVEGDNASAEMHGSVISLQNSKSIT
jgi:hypothetical protein